ncbi:MAG: hypothetical protein ACO20H_11820 [Bacteriovoracaceae bacterium]
MKSFTTLIILLLSFEVLGLSIDEKLTLRILKVSDTQKTVLINRGAEDGLMVGDHAKLYVTQGIVARGVVMKTSPSRSVWSLYSISDADKVRSQSVLSLKITEEYKVSLDSSKMLSKDDRPTGVMVTGDMDDEMKEDMIALKREAPSSGKYYQNLDTSEDSRAGGRGTLGMRSTEVFGTFNYLSFSETEDNGFEGVEATQKDSSEMSFSLGVEKYFEEKGGTLRNLSLLGQFDYSSTEEQEKDADSSPITSNTLMGASIGLNYHFYNDPFVFEQVILFASGHFGLGVISSSTEGSDSDSSSDGSYNTLSFGGGLKYYTMEGLGLRGQLDFYTRNENSTTDLGNEVVKKKSGPRIKFGMSYRF